MAQQPDADRDGPLVALVTGASRSIGAAVARLLAEAGADVVINHRSKGPRAQEVAAAVAALGRRSLAVQDYLPARRPGKLL